MITFCAGTLAVIGRLNISPGVAGLSISYALSITQALNWVVRMAAERENNIVSVERVTDYVNLPQEPAHNLPETCQLRSLIRSRNTKDTDPPAASWPLSGSIEFHKVFLRYRPDLPVALNGLTMQIKAKEKVQRPLLRDAGLIVGVRGLHGNRIHH
eukprot:Skav213304  [mRNA]  locus=scaffold2480:629977:631252:- [translate_table: standard]